MFLAVCLGGLSLLASGVRSAPRTPPAVGSAEPAGEQSVLAVAATIDAEFRKSWEAQGLTPTASVDRLTAARRLWLGMAGTIPSLEEIRRLEKNTGTMAGVTSQASERLRQVEQLFADRRVHDYLAERFARSYVGVIDGPFVLFRRRRFVTWLADQFQAGRPYDDIVRELITGTGLWTDHPATNFITVTIQPDADPQPNINTLAARVARAFLARRIDCAECHDHPFEPWKQSDFEGLAAYFHETRNKDLSGIQDVPQASEYQIEDRVTGRTRQVVPKVPFEPQLIPQEGTLRQRLAGWVTHPENRDFSLAVANRIWAVVFGRPLVEPVDDLRTTDETPPVLELLADDFRKSGFDLRRLIKVIVATEVFALDSKLAEADEHGLTSDHEAVWASFPIVRLRSEQVVGSLMQSASLSTLGYQSHILVRLTKAIGQGDFIRRYGDAGEDEFLPGGGTIPQRLLLMNGDLIDDKIANSIVANAAPQIAALAPDDATAVEIAFLAVLTRKPTSDEVHHFSARLQGTQGEPRSERLADLYWSLLNSTEFAWNH